MNILTEQCIVRSSDIYNDWLIFSILIQRNVFQNDMAIRERKTLFSMDYYTESHESILPEVICDVFVDLFCIPEKKNEERSTKQFETFIGYVMLLVTQV